VKIILLYST